MEHTQLDKAILFAEKLGPGWTVYRVYGTTVYKFVKTNREWTLMDIGHKVVHRTAPEEPVRPNVYNRGSWNERED